MSRDEQRRLPGRGVSCALDGALPDGDEGAAWVGLARLSVLAALLVGDMSVLLRYGQGLGAGWGVEDRWLRLDRRVRLLQLCDFQRILEVVLERLEDSDRTGVKLGAALLQLRFLSQHLGGAEARPSLQYLRIFDVPRVDDDVLQLHRVNCRVLELRSLRLRSFHRFRFVFEEFGTVEEFAVLRVVVIRRFGAAWRILRLFH